MENMHHPKRFTPHRLQLFRLAYFRKSYNLLTNLQIGGKILGPQSICFELAQRLPFCLIVSRLSGFAH